MRIAMISTPFLPVPPREYGGTELVVHELVEALIERGHEVTLFATGDSRSRAETRALFATAQWPPEMYTELEHVAWALSEVVCGDFDVVHAHSGAALPCARLAPGLPMIYTLHHVQFEPFSALYRRCLDPWYVAISHDQARRETPLPRSTVIHHGLNPASFACTERAAGNYVCFLGRLNEEKGPHTAIDVARAAGVPIQLAGEILSWDQAFAEREVFPRMRDTNATYLGGIGLEVKRAFLRDARALLAPIAWEEPFGLIFIEAMLSGCPVIAFPRGSIPELVEDGVTGFVVRNAEEMAQVIRPGGPVDAFDRHGCRARAIERYSRDRMAAEYGRLYEQAIACRDTAGNGAATRKRAAVV